MRLIYKQLRLYINYILGSNTFSYCAMTIYILFNFSNQIQFELKSINQEFILFRKTLI